ncbi:BLUF domain-containing protein [Larkinella rosea]|uniref:BLUF domain-containing protein n=1 Tax=Larkinella rosea TaxID=2025312 RepID=A0A3P1C3I4_9BACT|nr:BLUF domain-containing protein [Larkinella rosea]RRB07858.1 BLUF domain-containing protein [Larkinella rosea]
MDYCIVYLSSSKALLSNEELTAILHLSRKNNNERGITGILLYFNGSIIQALEGPKEKVKALYATICQDTRHLNVTPLYSKAIAKRSFGDWSMGYRTLSATELKDLTSLRIGKGGQPLGSKSEDSIVLRLIQLFYMTNSRN